MSSVSTNHPTAPLADPKPNGEDRDAASTVAATAARANEAAQEFAGRVTETASSALQDAHQTADQLQTNLTEAVRRNPTTAVLGAVGVGVLIGLALRGRS